MSDTVGDLSENTQKHIDKILQSLGPTEKTALLSGENAWRTVALEAHGVGHVVMTDGPHGVRATKVANERTEGPATCFPTGIAMAATWDPELIHEVGKALARETRAYGCDILLGPCVNIIRIPLAGRNFESYSEDPYLAGAIATAWIRGLQSEGVGASLKHYACNNQEFERMRGNSVVDERALREIYLPAFETAVKNARPWTVMCAYNRINGDYASQHHRLLTQILRDEWGFDGVVVSDWGANHTIVESVQAGLDLEMPGPAKYYGRLLAEALYTWQIEQGTVDQAARRILTLAARCGKLGNAPTGTHHANLSENQDLARRVSEASITLLQNREGVLPLDRSVVKTLAVIGPNAAEARIGGGGSSFVDPPYSVSPLDGLKALLGDETEIRYEKGCENYVAPPPVPADWILDNGGVLELFPDRTLTGEPADTRPGTGLDIGWVSGPGDGTIPEFGARWVGRIAVPESGRYLWRISNSGIARVYVDNKLVVETEEHLTPPSWPVHDTSWHLDMQAGTPYSVRIELEKPAALGIPFVRIAAGFSPPPEKDTRINRAAEAAAEADAAVVFVGMPTGYESEGRDRPDMHLPGRQNELVSAVLERQPNTVVVLNNGSPVALPWLSETKAIIQAYYMGQEGGNAVAKALFGDVNPSGKLTVTYPRRLEDTPAYVNYPGAREVHYGESIFVGYRYYDTKGLGVAFPFGHGLSYTEFAYTHMTCPSGPISSLPVEVTVTVRNTGTRAGHEVVQLYVADPESRLLRPEKELKGFSKLALEAGQEATVHFTLDRRAFSYYDPETRDWVLEPGEFRVLIGSSSRDIRQTGTLTVATSDTTEA